MGMVREPKGVDLLVGPSTLTKSDKERISLVIEEYKRTGKKPRLKQKISKADEQVHAVRTRR